MKLVENTPSGLLIASLIALLATTAAAAVMVSSNEQNVLEGKREMKKWMESGNHEAEECEDYFESEEWDDASDGEKEAYYDETQEEVRESGGSGTEGAREGRIEWLRENKEDQDGKPRPKPDAEVSSKPVSFG